MTRGHRYVMLVSSLPALPPLFAAKQTPIARWKLDERLTWLEPEDAGRLAALRTLLAWSEQPPQGDAAVLDRYRSLRARLDGDLRDGLEARMALRVTLAAMRRRRRGAGPPQDDVWGEVVPLARMRARWSDAEFGLGGVYPWLRLLAAAAASGDPRQLERRALAIAWEDLSRRADRHAFDFEAVALYVLRWHLVARWSAYRPAAAAARFETLAAAAGGSADEKLTEALA